MTAKTYRHIFGPVLSRRLGRSLGVDIIPFKTCTYDCIYCEQGRTTTLTAERMEYVPVADVLLELEDFLGSHSAPDYVTISGAGEPTLHAGLGQIIGAIKRLTKVPVAVITNGSLLWERTVRDALQDADVVLPSLDAGNETLFRTLDRPVNGISFEQMISGLIDFRQSFRNQLWLEVMFVADLNSAEPEVQEIAALVGRIRPDRVQLNTVARPPSESFALPVSRERLESLAGMFDPRGEIIADCFAPVPEDGLAPEEARILELLERRPCPAAEITSALGLRPVETLKLLENLVRQKKVVEKRFGTGTFFTAAPGSEGEAG